MKGFLHVLLWIVEFTVGLAVIACVLAFLLPWLISYDGTRAIILGFLKGPLKAQITIEKAHVSWWDATSLENITYKDALGNMQFVCKSLTTSSSLWKIAFGAHELGNLNISNPLLTLSLEGTQKPTAVAIQAAGIPPLPILAHLDLQQAWKNLTPKLTGSLTLTDGAIDVQGARIEDVRLENLQFSMTLPEASDYVKFSLSGVTRQGETTGSLNWTGNFGPLESPDPTLTIQGNLKALPMLGVDQVIALFHRRWEGVAVSAIGQKLDLDMQFALSNQRLDIAFNANSSQFSAILRTMTENGVISLVAPASFSLTVTSYLAEEFFSLSPYFRALGLANSPLATLNISQLAIPVLEDGIGWSKLKMDAMLNVIDLKFGTPLLISDISFESLKASLKTDLLERELIFDGQAAISFGTNQALVATSGTISDPLAKVSPTTYAYSTKAFPLPILDKIFNTEGFLQDALGPTCDFAGSVDQNPDNRSGFFSFSSANLNMNNATLHLFDGGFNLNAPIQITYTPDRSFWEKHAGGIGFGPIDFAVQEFIYTYADSSKTKTKGTGTSPQFFYKNFSLPNLNVVFDIETLASINLNGTAEGLTTSTVLGYDRKKDIFSFVQPLTLAITLDPDQAASFWKEFDPSPPTFLEPVAITAQILPISTPLGQNYMKNVTLQGNLNVASLSFSRDQATSMLKNGVCTWLLDTSANQFTAKLDASIGTDVAVLTPLHADFIGRKFYFQPRIDMSGAQYLAKISCDKLDTRFLDGWLPKNRSLSPLLGSWVTLKGSILQGTQSSSFNFTTTCEKGTLNINLARADDQLTLDGNQPLTASLLVDQAGLTSLQNLLGKTLPMSLGQPCQLQLRISSMNLPLQKGTFDLDNSQLPQATMECTLMSSSVALIENATKNPVTLSNLTFRLSRPDLSSPTLLQLRTSIDAAKPGQVDVAANIQGILQTDKGWDLSHMNATIKAAFQQLPTSVMSTVATAIGSTQGANLMTLFGEQISGTAQAAIQNNSGPVSVLINSPSTRLSLNGSLQNGILLLDDPFVAQVTMTEEISRLFLKGLSPLPISAVRSDGPMTLIVDKENFYLPMFPWTIAKALIPHMRIELGKLVCRNEGNIHTTLDLLKQGQFSRSKDLNLWFAPMDLSLRQGIVNCERTEILVQNSIEIATWGNIDLIDNYVDAILGIPAPTLSSAFGVSGLPDNYVLQIPMKGPLDNVNIDVSSATSKIGLVLAWQKASQAAGNALGGTPGALIGGLVGKAMKLPEGDKPTPAAKHPFPWENQSSPPTQLSPKKKKSAIRPGDKPLKQLLKLLK